MLKDDNKKLTESEEELKNRKDRKKFCLTKFG